MSEHGIPGHLDLTTNQLVQRIVESNANGSSRFCFILGAGASVESDIPTGKELEKKWMDCIMGKAEDPPAPKKNPQESRKLAIALKAKKLIEHSFNRLKANWIECCSDPQKKMRSDYYFDIFRLRFYTDLTSGFRYLEKIMEGCFPSRGYYPLSMMLAKEPNKHNLVITTNFDNLVEDALFIFSDKKPLVIGHESLVDYIDFNVQRPIVAKLHRSLFYEPYNTIETTQQLNEKWKKVLNNAFDTYTPIVIGYAGGDKSLMAFLKEETTIMRNGILWCYMKTDPPTDDIIELINKKNINGKSFFVQIEGFNKLMHDIGVGLFGNRFELEHIKEFLLNKTQNQINEYEKHWNK